MNIRRTLVAVGAALGAIVGSLALFDVRRPRPRTPPTGSPFGSRATPPTLRTCCGPTTTPWPRSATSCTSAGTSRSWRQRSAHRRRAGLSGRVQRHHRCADPGLRARLDGKVYALATSDDGTTLYVGGSFTTVNGQLIGGFATLDASTGALKAGVTQRSTDGEVHAIYKDGSALYVGGQFQKFGGTNNRKMMAKLDISTPAQTVNATFAPQFVGGLVAAIDIPPDHSRVYAGGRFTTLDGTAVGKIVA